MHFVFREEKKLTAVLIESTSCCFSSPAELWDRFQRNQQLAKAAVSQFVSQLITTRQTKQGQVALTFHYFFHISSYQLIFVNFFNGSLMPLCPLFLLPTTLSRYAQGRLIEIGIYDILIAPGISRLLKKQTRSTFDPFLGLSGMLKAKDREFASSLPPIIRILSFLSFFLLIWIQQLPSADLCLLSRFR